MARHLLGASALAAVLAIALGGPVGAHTGGAGSGISVEPTQVAAGGTVVLAGQGLEANSERQINLVGPDVIVPFPPVTTDGDGMFAVTLTIPSHLPAGTYTFQAIADETLTVELAITAAAGVVAAAPANEAATVEPRSRSALGVAALGVFLVLVVGLGILFVVGAERFGRAARSR